MRLRSSKKQIAYDQIPESSPVRRLYEDEETLRFVAGVLGLEELYRLDDPLAALGHAYMEPGDTLAWHFDRSEFAVTLMLQTAERGGAFQYVPNVRSEADERPELVAAVLEERSDQVVSLHPQPGTLTLFRGRRSLHRVSPVEGGRVRVNAVLAYGHEPGMRLNELTQRLFYGTVA
jgi:catechol 2,3-dioxygenase-like lactoylglutathione lyase family enzyme